LRPVVVEADSPEVIERFESSVELVRKFASKLVRTFGGAFTVEELESYGMEGLLEASRRFDPERGVPFRGYASFRIRGAIIDGARALSTLPRRVHERLKLLEDGLHVSEGAYEDLSTTHSPSGSGPPGPQAERALHDHLAAMATAMATGLVSTAARDDEGVLAAVDTAPTPEAATAKAELMQVVREAITELPDDEAELVRRHYLEGERFDHVAADLQLSKSWASRLHKRAMGRLTKRLKQQT
jgi:RNA polymerase sigma factor FliA